ncbi:MAG: hypothetical protein AAGE52_01390 [Myxococcota bacterium]
MRVIDDSCPWTAEQTQKWMDWYLSGTGVQIAVYREGECPLEHLVRTPAGLSRRPMESGTYLFRKGEWHHVVGVSSDGITGRASLRVMHMQMRLMQAMHNR